VGTLGVIETEIVTDPSPGLSVILIYQRWLTSWLFEKDVICCFAVERWGKVDKVNRVIRNMVTKNF